jgi:diguanylate cyclase (GGDEF)-like protein
LVELALPHVVVRVCGPGVGIDVVASLTVHPVEVSEARDVWEMHRVAGGRPPIVVVVVDPPDAKAIVAETWADLPGVPILIISDSIQPFPPSETGRGGWVDTIPSSQPLQDICWLVLEAVSRAARAPGIVEHPLGPHLIEVDDRGIVTSAALIPDVAIAAIRRLRPGDALPSFVEPLERSTISHAIAQAGAGDTQFHTVRLLDDRGHRHTMAFGMRRVDAARVAILAQPLISGGPIVGRHVNHRDPITGLLTRWAMSRALEAHEADGPAWDRSTVILLMLDHFATISSSIGHRQTDAVLLSVAAALNQVFPYPALTSRLMGDSFVAYVSSAENDEHLHRAERLLTMLGGIDVPGFAPRLPLQASIGVAHMVDGDHDLALRLAEAAAAEARAAGGNRVIVARSPAFTHAQAHELTASMDRGSWEMWLQPVVRHGNGQAVYHEALARFDAGPRHLASRADFFTAGKAEGLLERFDRMMLQRALEMLESHPDARLSVNVSYETFVSRQFPGAYLDLIRRVPDGCERIILEIASRCVAAPDEVARPRLESLAAAGVAVALDDFGSGICRLRYLTQLPLAIVKLDQLVTGYIDDDPLQRDFVRTVVSLCRARGITTVAEYTRSEEQLARLIEDGIDLFQGELFGMPRPAAEAIAPAAVEPARG